MAVGLHGREITTKMGKKIVNEKITISRKRTAQATNSVETQTVQQQLAALTKSFSAFMVKQEEVNSTVSASLEKLTPKTNGFH
jgi:Cu/Zn superoxide dismutase